MKCTKWMIMNCMIWHDFCVIWRCCPLQFMTVLCFVSQRRNVGISSQNSHPSPNNLKWLIQEYQHPHNCYFVYIFGDKVLMTSKSYHLINGGPPVANCMEQCNNLSWFCLSFVKLNCCLNHWRANCFSMSLPIMKM